MFFMKIYELVARSRHVVCAHCDWWLVAEQSSEEMLIGAMLISSI